MRKFFTLCMFILGGLLMGAQAQTVDETFQFTDSGGNVIPDGSSMTYSNFEVNPFGNTIVESGLRLINATGTPGAFSIICTVNSISNGQFQICVNNVCTAVSETGIIETERGAGPASLDTDLQTEWMAQGTGTCDVTYQVFRHTAMEGGETYPGATIHVLFSTDEAAGISGVAVSGGESEVVARYTLGGARLSAPQKGVNIVKYADGSTRKVVVK